MKKLKVMTVVGTRPEIIRLARQVSKAGQQEMPLIDKDTDEMIRTNGEIFGMPTSGALGSCE